MNNPTPAEIESRAKADYEKHCADLLARLRTGREASRSEFYEWGDPEAGELWDVFRDAARKALIKEREDA